MDNKKNKKLFITIIISFLVFICMCIICMATLLLKKENRTTNNEMQEEIEQSKDENDSFIHEDNIYIVPTMLDPIAPNSSWCCTFQLVWNDVKNKLAKKDIILNPQLDIVKNLNKEDFDESMLSEEYYYKIYGPKTLELKEQIENGIKEKFDQRSDILNNIDWSRENSNDVLFYSMLYRKFEFFQKFNKLDNDKFGNKYEDVEYFGIDNYNIPQSVRNQIRVLYYNSKDDFALVIDTKSNDEVIFCKNPKGNTFDKIYKNMNKKIDKYEGSNNFEELDRFKAPILNFDETKEYEELSNKEFRTAEGEKIVIKNAMQTLKLSIDENGGEIKSELNLLAKASASIDEKDEGRYFYVDDTFAIFLREKGKDKPYFAGRIDDISKFQ